MLAFQNTTITKPHIIKQLEDHAKADDFIKGTYWENGKGCAVGCTIHSNNHIEYEKRFGIPQMLARLEDCIFEGLQNSEAKAWPLRFMKAVKPGADLTTVGWEFQHRLQINNLKFAKEQKFPEDVIKAIQLTIDVLEPMAKGKPIEKNAAWSAESAARSAASVSSGAAESVAWSAASAAESVSWNEESEACAARSAAESVAGSVAGSVAYEKMADLLIEIIEQH